MNAFQRYTERKKLKRVRQVQKEAERDEQARDKETQGRESDNEECMDNSDGDEQNLTVKDIGTQTELTVEEISSMEVKCFSVSRAQETYLSEEFLKSDNDKETQTSVIDKIVIVCVALCNLCDSVVRII